MQRHPFPPEPDRLNPVRILLALLLLVTLVGCGGSMGSNPPGSVTSKRDPPSGGTSTAPAASSATPTATAGSLSGAYYSTITGTLNGSNSCNCGTPAFALVSQPSHGTLTLTNAAKGTFSYTPEPGFAGTDSFTFYLGNGQATSATATETLTISPTAIGAETVPANIGAVLDGITYYSITQPYVDMMRATGNGGGQTWVGAGASAGVGDLAKAGLLDTNGWPQVDAAVLVAVGANADGSKADPGIGSVLFGKHQLSFQGIASIGDDGGKVENQNYDPATDTTTATLDQTPLHSDGSGFDMLLSFTKTQRTASSATNTGITDVHVIRPQFAPNGAKWWDSPTQEFTDPFLASLAPFSTLRFMDWTATNGSQVANWDQRTPADWVGGHEIETDSAWEWNGTDHKTEPTDNWWSPTGQSWQSVIDLANATGKDIWINIPIRATDDYVTSLATLLKNGLDPGIHVYVEYSNEVWNGSFEQWFYNDAATKQLLATDTTEAANYQKNCTSNSICHEAERLMQISNDFASVWGGPAINAAIRPVFCNQEVGPGSMQTALDFINNTYGPPAKYFYGICSAPYRNPASVSAGESVDNLLAASAPSIPKWDGYLLAWTATARYAYSAQGGQ